jgi:hypothetical protein
MISKYFYLPGSSTVVKGRKNGAFRRISLFFSKAGFQVLAKVDPIR